MVTLSRHIRVELLSHTPLSVCGKLANTERGVNYFDDKKAVEIALKLAKQNELEVFKFSQFVIDCVVPFYAIVALNKCFNVNLQQKLSTCSLNFYGSDKANLEEICEYLLTANSIIAKNKAYELMPCNVLVRSSYAFSLVDLLNARECLEKEDTTRFIFREIVSEISRTEWEHVANILLGNNYDRNN